MTTTPDPDRGLDASGRPVPEPVVLVMAKAPVPGQAKTRLGVVVGDQVAAELAAASVLDTLDVCERVFPDVRRRHLALAGDLSSASRGAEIAERLSGWTVHAQRGDGFAARLVQAHRDVADATGAPVVQIGMDTPHVTAHQLGEVTRRVGVGNDAVLGPAADGGWWVLAVAATPGRDDLVAALAGVEMSTSRTYDDTLEALRHTGAVVADAVTLRDVDDPDDAAAAALAAPDTRFALRWANARD